MKVGGREGWGREMEEVLRGRLDLTYLRRNNRKLRRSMKVLVGRASNEVSLILRSLGRQMEERLSLMWCAEERERRKVVGRFYMMGNSD